MRNSGKSSKEGMMRYSRLLIAVFSAVLLVITICYFCPYAQAYGPSGDSGCVSAGAMRAASRSGGTQSSSSNSNGGAPSWSFGGGGGGSSGGGGSGGSSGSFSGVSVSGNQLQSMYNAGAFSGGNNPFSASGMASLSSGVRASVSNILSSSQMTSIQQIGSSILSIAGTIGLKGVPVVTAIGVLPAGQNWQLQATTVLGNVYKDTATGKLFGQSSTGMWHSVDSRGDWGGEVREAFQGSRLILAGDMSSNKDRYGPDPSFGYQLVVPIKDGNTFAVLNVKEDGATSDVRLVGMAGKSGDGLIITQLDNGVKTGKNIWISGDISDAADQIAQNAQLLGQNVKIYTRIDEKGILHEAKLTIYGNGEYSLREGNQELASSHTPMAITEYFAREEVGVKLAQLGYDVEAATVDMVVNRPGDGLVRTGTLEGRYLFTDQYTGRRYALEWNPGTLDWNKKATWYEMDLNDELHRLSK
jgi:hypothetical protein